jgi:hypothetical protein
MSEIFFIAFLHCCCILSLCGGQAGHVPTCRT